MQEVRGSIARNRSMDAAAIADDKDKSMFITPQALSQGRANLARYGRGRTQSMAVNRLNLSKTELQGIKHFKFPPLSDSARVGFSLRNLTGQPVRYLQTWIGEGNLRTIEYLMHGETGLLNFIASTTKIRNSIIVEEAFGVQQDYHRDVALKSGSKLRSRARTAGHLLQLQICGYKWLSDVRADALGVSFADLAPLDGCPNVLKLLLTKDRKKERE